MKVLFAVSNEKMSESIRKRYQTEYKQIISYKNVYYFNAILKELQKDKTYDRVVISEDLEQYVNNDYNQMDKFLFDRLDSISDEASNMKGEDIPIILICDDRRSKSEPILVKLFGIGVYNAIIGNDRSVGEVCRLINRPRSKKEAKQYYKIETDEVSYEPINENDVSEMEIQNILAHYSKLGNDEKKYVESFNSIASQYNKQQLKVISKCLPLNVRAVLEEKSPKYQEINSFNAAISNDLRNSQRSISREKTGPSEVFLKSNKEKKLSEPVVVPSEIGINQRKKIITNKVARVDDIVEEKMNKENSHEEIMKNEESLLDEIELEEIPAIEDIPEKDFMPEVDVTTLNSMEENQEIEKPKRGRGRPKKIVTEPVVQGPKRKRGRPRKNEVQDDLSTVLNENNDEDVVLPGFENIEESIKGNEEEAILPGFDEQDNKLPGFDEEDTILPGFDEEDSVLPGFDEEEIELPNNEDDGKFSVNEEDTILPEFQDETEISYNKTLNTKNEIYSNDDDLLTRTEKREEQYEELDIENLMNVNQKLVAFVGTSKNGTSFLINNVAELLSKNGIDTAILDLTKNRNAYYIYTKNDEDLRVQSNSIMYNLKNGNANGIIAHNNLTVYTSAYDSDDNIMDVEHVIETLIRNHTVVLMDCDFTTPSRYFKYAQEIYIVQSMDILTIQPLTAFLRQLKDKGALEESKVRVVLNKYIKTREINENLLIGGISIYNDPGMTLRKELFNRKTVKYLTIPFDLKSYLRYLDGLVICDVTTNGYTKEFLQSLNKLAIMVYPINKKNGKYNPPSIKNNNVDFSSKTNKTLNQMKQNY